MLPTAAIKWGRRTRDHPEADPLVCAQVWRALCKPHNVIVAVKLLDLENMNCNLVIRQRSPRPEQGAPAWPVSYGHRDHRTTGRSSCRVVMQL